MGHEKTAFVCDCVGSCTVLGVDYWSPFDDESPEQWDLEVYTQVGSGSTWSHRLRTAWKILRGREHYLDALVLHPPQAEKLRDFLNETLP